MATGAYVPSVVAVEDLPPANGLLSLGSSMNQIVGLSLGGIFVAFFGVALPIEYDALSFFAAAVLIALIPRASPVPAVAGAPAGSGPSSWKGSTSSGRTGSWSRSSSSA